MTGRRAGLLAVVLGVLLAGCGVPTGGTPNRIEPTDIPYGLASPSPTATPTPSAEATTDPSRVYWVSAEDAVVPRVREVSGSTRRERLAFLLEQLAAGPSRAERDEQLYSLLPPEVRLSVTGFDDGTATIDLQVQDQALSVVAGRRAVAQIVLTATSVPGVEAVLLELAGEPIEAPLPAGALTAGPLTAQDYAVATTPSPTAVPAPTAVPEVSPVPAAPPS